MTSPSNPVRQPRGGGDVLGPLLADARVTVVETREDPADPFLFPEEAEVVARAVDKRRNEFATVRQCARTALAELGVRPAPILPGPKGAPRWPDGIVGSMTHCAGYRAAAVARASDVLSIGIDAEPAAPLDSGDVLDLVTDEKERTALARLGVRHPEVPWDRLLFSAKESVYKTWFPLTGRWLGFEDARVDLGPDGTFTAALLVPGPKVAGRELTGFAGNWLIRDGIAVTGIVMPLTPPPPGT